MTRTHCASSSDPIVLQDASNRGGQGVYKPPGFWYQVDGDWERWASGEGFPVGDYLFDVWLGSAKVLKIDDVRKLDRFQELYFDPNGLLPDVGTIDWPRVMKEHDGLEIAPYRYERRLVDQFSWYYGWDCASGVIWRPRDATVTYVGTRTGSRPLRETVS